MAKKNNSTLLIIVAILILIASLGFCSKQPTIINPLGEGRIIHKTVGDQTQYVQSDLAVRPHFADGSQTEIRDQSLEMSTVSWSRPGGIVCNDCTYTNVFFTYMDVAAYLTGPIDTQVRITNIEAFDQAGNASSRKINYDLLNQRWTCIKNIPVILTRTNTSGGSGSQYIWSPFTCAQDLAWLPTSVFETKDVTGQNIIQPILFRFTLEGTYSDYLGRSKTSTRNAEIILKFVENGTLGEGFTGEVLFSGNQSTNFFAECNVSKKSPCPNSDKVNSACFGVSQTCLGGALSTGPNGETGYWPGCTWNMYATNTNGITYTGNNEAGSQFWITCKDGKDNDCDGTIDNKNKGTILKDSDCPDAVVKFRTGASTETEIDYTNNWIVLDAIPQTGLDYRLEIYKYFSTQTFGSACSVQPLCTNDIITRTPGNLPVTIRYTGNTQVNGVYVCFDTGGQCKVLKYVPGSINDCGVETACNIIGATYPFGVREVVVDYPYTRFA